MEMLTGNGKPTRNTKGLKGQFYKDLDTGDIYECEVSSEFSTLHHAPIGGYLWKLKADGNGDDIIKDNALYEQIADIHKDIVIVKQSGLLTSPVKFAEAAEIATNETNHANVVLVSTSVDTATMAINIEAYKATGLRAVKSLATSEILYLQFEFRLFGDVKATYRFNPDETITEVTA